MAVLHASRADGGTLKISLKRAADAGVAIVVLWGVEVSMFERGNGRWC